MRHLIAYIFFLAISGQVFSEPSVRLEDSFPKLSKNWLWQAGWRIDRSAKSSLEVKSNLEVPLLLKYKLPRYFSLRFFMKFPESEGEAGLVLMGEGSARRLRFSIRSSKSTEGRLAQVGEEDDQAYSSEGRPSSLPQGVYLNSDRGQRIFYKPKSIRDSEWHQVEILAEGPAWSFFIDHQKVGSFFPKRRLTTFGFWSKGQNPTLFDEFELDSFPTQSSQGFKMSLESVSDSKNWQKKSGTWDDFSLGVEKQWVIANVGTEEAFLRSTVDLPDDFSFAMSLKGEGAGEQGLLLNWQDSSHYDKVVVKQGRKTSLQVVRVRDKSEDLLGEYKLDSTSGLWVSLRLLRKGSTLMVKIKDELALSIPSEFQGRSFFGLYSKGLEMALFKNVRFYERTPLNKISTSIEASGEYLSGDWQEDYSLGIDSGPAVAIGLIEKKFTLQAVLEGTITDAEEFARLAFHLENGSNQIEINLISSSRKITGIVLAKGKSFIGTGAIGNQDAISGMARDSKNATYSEIQRFQVPYTGGKEKLDVKLSYERDFTSKAVSLVLNLEGKEVCRVPLTSGGALSLSMRCKGVCHWSSLRLLKNDQRAEIKLAPNSGEWLLRGGDFTQNSLAKGAKLEFDFPIRNHTEFGFTDIFYSSNQSFRYSLLSEGKVFSFDVRTSAGKMEFVPNSGKNKNSIALEPTLDEYKLNVQRSSGRLVIRIGDKKVYNESLSLGAIATLEIQHLEGEFEFKDFYVNQHPEIYCSFGSYSRILKDQSYWRMGFAPNVGKKVAESMNSPLELKIPISNQHPITMGLLKKMPERFELQCDLNVRDFENGSFRINLNSKGSTRVMNFILSDTVCHLYWLEKGKPVMLGEIRDKEFTLFYQQDSARSRISIQAGQSWIKKHSVPVSSLTELSLTGTSSGEDILGLSQIMIYTEGPKK